MAEKFTVLSYPVTFRIIPGVTPSCCWWFLQCGCYQSSSHTKIICDYNQTMLELHNFLNRNPSCTYYTYWQWAFAPVDPIITLQQLNQTIRQSIVRLSSKLTKLRKMPSSEEKCLKLAEFFNQEYELPNVFKFGRWRSDYLSVIIWFQLLSLCRVEGSCWEVT
jgi:hypothetical protein